MEEREMDVVPGLEGIAAAESSVSFIDGTEGVLEYRGIPIAELTEKSSFLETSYLLVFGRLPKEEELSSFTEDVLHHTRLKLKILRMMEALPESGHPMEFLQAVISAMGMYYPAKDTLNKSTHYISVVRLIAKLPTIVAATYRLKNGDAPIAPRAGLTFAANFYYMLFEEEPDPLIEKILDVAFILHAEHSMNASTFSSRVVASTLADPYTIVSSAIGTLSGPLHGGANEKVLKMLADIGSKEQVRGYIEGKIERKEKIMGVGHRVYKTKDPRATILQGYAHTLYEECGTRCGIKDTGILEIAEEVEKVVTEKLSAKKLYPNVDFYSGIVFSAIGIPSDLFTPIFAMGRVSGWLAHWLEQLSTNRIFRPTQKYIGERARNYVPINDR